LPKAAVKKLAKREAVKTCRSQFKKSMDVATAFRPELPLTGIWAECLVRLIGKYLRRVPDGIG
jgi:hypothetical protein